MKNTFGQSVSVTLFGESHGVAIGATLDGLAPGITVDMEYIRQKLKKRKPQGAISTARQEADDLQIVSGVFEGKTTGTPITILIKNGDTRSRDYAATRHLARPGHADYTAFCKYHGFEDYRGGGHFSGRITAALVAAGAIVQYALEQKGIFIGTHILRCMDICDRPFFDILSEVKCLKDASFPLLDCSKEELIKEKILAAKEKCDSIGGVLQTAVYGIPAGVGEPFFDTVEGMLAHAVFAIPAIKGVEFGDGFSFAEQFGSEANDCFLMDDGEIITKTNKNGGINGGITNGMPIIFQSAVKPTPSIAKEQDTVDFIGKKNCKIEIKGRHDPAIFHRAAVVIDCVTAITICDLLTLRYGTDYLLT